MDFELSEELVALRAAVARFADEQIAPHAQAWDRAEGYPDEMVQVLGDQGFMGVLVPEEYGGAGGDHMQLAIVLEEIARHDGGLALAVETHNGLCCQHILIAASHEQKKRWLPALASGEQIGSWCLSEPVSGSDAAAMKTQAVRDGDSWVLNGAKQFVTNGARAGTFVVLAVTDPSKGKRGISAFVVDRDTQGLSTGRPEDKLGMRSSDTVSLNMEDVRVAEDQVLGVVAKGFRDVKRALIGGRIMISARPGPGVGPGRVGGECPLREGARDIRKVHRPTAAHPGEAGRHGDAERGGSGSSLPSCSTAGRRQGDSTRRRHHQALHLGDGDEGLHGGNSGTRGIRLPA